MSDLDLDLDAAPQVPERLEDSLRRRARDFDVPTLLDLLRTSFPGTPVYFRSRSSPGPRPTLVEDVELVSGAFVVTLNIGLLSVGGPLPSYFQDLFIQVGGAALAALIERLDDPLLRARLATYQPEASAWLFDDVERFRADLRAIARPMTTGSLHGIFSALFPELSVRVERSSLRRAIPVERARLGRPVLGLAAMGGETEGRVAGFDVVLRTFESTTWGDVPWGAEARRRVLTLVVPLLEDRAAQLRVFLTDEEAAGELSIGRQSRLGIDALVRARRPNVATIFDGSMSTRTSNEENRVEVVFARSYVDG
jgi:predicted component of type VI protein secretion system